MKWRAACSGQLFFGGGCTSLDYIVATHPEHLKGDFQGEHFNRFFWHGILFCFTCVANMTEVSKASDLAAARRKAAGRLQQDLKLSLGQGQSLPDMLMMAPLAINLLGQIKLLAFSDKALCIHLEEPKDGFKYLQ